MSVAGLLFRHPVISPLGRGAAAPDRDPLLPTVSARTSDALSGSPVYFLPELEGPMTSGEDEAASQISATEYRQVHLSDGRSQGFTLSSRMLSCVSYIELFADRASLSFSFVIFLRFITQRSHRHRQPHCQTCMSRRFVCAAYKSSTSHPCQ